MRKLVLTFVTVFAFGLFAAAQTPGGTTGSNSQNNNSTTVNSNNSAAPVTGAATDPATVNGDQQRATQKDADKDASKDMSADNSAETTIDGCVVKEQNDYFIQPATGERERLVGGDDLSSQVGKEVKAHGSEQTATASATDRTSTSGSASTESQNNAAGSIAGNAGSSNASGTAAGASTWSGKDFMVTRIEKVSDSCPASTQK
jgi:hypothetical protein